MLSHGPIREKYTSTGKHSGYEVKLYHSGLDEYRHISAREYDLLEDKIHNAERIFQKKWDTEVARNDRETEKNRKLGRKEKALALTADAQETQDALKTILAHTLDIDDTLDWETLYSRKKFKDLSLKNEFPSLVFNTAGRPKDINPLNDKEAPNRSDYFLPIGFFKGLFGRKAKLLLQQEMNFNDAIKLTEKTNLKIAEKNKQNSLDLLEQKEIWDQRQTKFKTAQAKENSEVDDFKKRYQDKVADAIEEYCHLVLANSSYSDFFTKDTELQYFDTSKSLIVDFQLPDLAHIPTLSKVTYVATRDEVTEKHISDAALRRTYDDVVYQITLRTLHELFEADTADAIDLITFNGIVTSIDPATGRLATKCILTIQTTKDEFEAINLSQVDPKSCFKSLKGVAASKLSSITPVKPIQSMSREDSRFTDHYDVADALDDTTNLAAMDWEDFEHLIRELFAKEFSSQGGEVKVTKASRDGGVDAVAFDPDPIRGGKIIIQAKRYTNTVTVSAVRDLFGTVTSEGANKGILVTTADYGPDAYSFARDKPITLLNGANLLHLLASHGHSAKIDIAAAKALQN